MYLFFTTHIMKKTLLSLATFTLWTIITIGVVKASLEIGGLFHNNKPIVNTAYTQLLNDYDNSWWYNDNISISCDAEGETVTIVTPKVNDYIPDPVPEYRLFLSPYRVSQIKSGDPLVDNEKIIMIHQNIWDSAVLPSFKISSSDVESDQPYYGFIVPTDIYEEVWTPSKEICFQLNKNVCMLDTECDTFDLVINPTRTNITLKPWLNTFSTPAIVKSITFSNWWSNISISRMKNGKWERFAINSETLSEVRPLEGFLIRNDNSEAITMTLLYDTDNSSSLMITKDLDAWWNFLWVTNTTNPFNVIADATAALILDLTNWQSTNLIQLWKTFLNASKYMLWKAYAVFVNKSGWIYGWQNNYGDNPDNWQTYSSELQEAYEWAYENWIISEWNIDDANLYKALINLELAEIMNNFAENVLHQTPDPSKSCTFTDITSLTESQKAIITKVCQLWLMPGDLSSNSFNANENTNRAIFGSALSRVLWWTQYEWWTPYYANHLNALKGAGIMSNIDHPEQGEIKWYVLAMLMHALDDTDTSDTEQSVQTWQVDLTNNITGTVEFKSNEIVKKTVFDGTYTALNNEGRHINTIEFEGNYCYDNCPLSWEIEFCLEIRWEEYCTMPKDVNKWYSYIKLSEKIDLNLNEPEHIVVTAEYAWNYGTWIFDVEMSISDDYGFYGYHRVDLAPIRIVESNTCWNWEEDEWEDCDNCPEDLEICD